MTGIKDVFGIDVQGAIIVLLFIAPGFVYSRSYLAVRPRYAGKGGPFEQIVVAVVGSALINAVLIGSLAALILLYLVVTGKDPTLGEILKPAADMASTPVSTAVRYYLLAATYVVVSLLFARRMGATMGNLMPERYPRWYRRLIGGDAPERVLLWYSTLVEEPIRKGYLKPKIAVWMRTGERLEGNLAELRLASSENDVIELALDNVLVTQKHSSESARSSRARHARLALEQHRILVRSSDVLWISRIDP